MDMRMTTLENGWRAVVTERQAAAMSGAGQSAFAAELERAAGTAARTEASGDTDLGAAYDRLSDGSKAVLSRLKSGAADISRTEWDDLRRELKETGLITETEYFYTHPDIVVLGKAEDFRDGGVVVVSEGPAVSYGFGDIEWTGDLFQYLDQWLELLRRERDLWAEPAQQYGTPLDLSPRTRQIEAHEKVSALVRELVELG